MSSLRARSVCFYLRAIDTWLDDPGMASVFARTEHALGDLDARDLEVLTVTVLAAQGISAALRQEAERQAERSLSAARERRDLLGRAPR